MPKHVTQPPEIGATRTEVVHAPEFPHPNNQFGIIDEEYESTMPVTYQVGGETHTTWEETQMYLLDPSSKAANYIMSGADMPHNFHEVGEMRVPVVAGVPQRVPTT